MTKYSIEDCLYGKGLEEVFANIRKDAPKSISEEEIRADTRYHFDQILATVASSHETWLAQNPSTNEVSANIAAILLQGHRNGLLNLLTMGSGVSKSTAEEIVDNHILIHT